MLLGDMTERGEKVFERSGHYTPSSKPYSEFDTKQIFLSPTIYCTLEGRSMPNYDSCKCTMTMYGYYDNIWKLSCKKLKLFVMVERSHCLL